MLNYTRNVVASARVIFIIYLFKVYSVRKYQRTLFLLHPGGTGHKIVRWPQIPGV